MIEAALSLPDRQIIPWGGAHCSHLKNFAVESSMERGKPSRSVAVPEGGEPGVRRRRHIFVLLLPLEVPSRMGHLWNENKTHSNVVPATMYHTVHFSLTLFPPELDPRVVRTVREWLEDYEETTVNAILSQGQLPDLELCIPGGGEWGEKLSFKRRLGFWLLVGIGHFKFWNEVLFMKQIVRNRNSLGSFNQKQNLKYLESCL